MCAVVHGTGGRGGEPGRGTGIERAAGQPVGEALALDQLHAEVTPAVELAHLVDRHDVRMVKAGDRLGLVSEPAQVVVAGPRPGAEHLERDEAVEAALPRLVDDAHAPAAEDPVHFVVAEVAPAARQVGFAGATVTVTVTVVGLGQVVDRRRSRREGGSAPGVRYSAVAADSVCVGGTDGSTVAIGRSGLIRCWKRSCWSKYPARSSARSGCCRRKASLSMAWPASRASK